MGYAIGGDTGGCACRGEDHHLILERVCLVTGGVMDGLGVRWAEPLRDEGFKSRLWSREW